MLYHVTIQFNKDFVSVSGDQITVGVMAKPIGGAANMEAVKKVAKHFGVSSAAVTIRSGHKSSQKVFEISQP